MSGNDTVFPRSPAFGGNSETPVPSVPVARIDSCSFPVFLSGVSFGRESRASLTFNSLAYVYVAIVSRMSE